MNKKILIVDDDKAILEGMQLALEAEGYDVMTAVDDSHLQNELKDGLPDLILLDIFLPGKNGEDIAIDLRKNKKTNKIPIIFISGSHNIREVAQKAQANDFLAKPFDLEDLTELVKKYT